jgi:hypothetical protein
MSHLQVSQHINAWMVDNAFDQNLETAATKTEAVAAAQQLAKDGDFSHVLIYDTDGELHRTWWNKKFRLLVVEYNKKPALPNWQVWSPISPTEFFHEVDTKSEAVDHAKELQEDRGYRDLQIQKKNGNVSWTRNHPDARGR